MSYVRERAKKVGGLEKGRGRESSSQEDGGRNGESAEKEKRKKETKGGRSR